MAQAQTREGRWLGVGLGVGALARDGVTPAVGPMGRIGIGIHVSERVMLAAEASYLLGRSASHSVNQLALGPMVYLYPRRSGGFFLRIGADWARLTEEDPYQFELSDHGWALFVGLGAETPWGQSKAVRPFVNLGLESYSSTFFGLVEVGVGLSFR